MFFVAFSFLDRNVDVRFFECFDDAVGFFDECEVDPDIISCYLCQEFRFFKEEK